MGSGIAPVVVVSYNKSRVEWWVIMGHKWVPEWWKKSIIFRFFLEKKRKRERRKSKVKWKGFKFSDLMGATLNFTNFYKNKSQISRKEKSNFQILWKWTLNFPIFHKNRALISHFFLQKRPDFQILWKQILTFQIFI